MKLNRRQFLKRSGVAAAGLAAMAIVKPHEHEFVKTPKFLGYECRYCPAVRAA